MSTMLLRAPAAPQAVLGSRRAALRSGSVASTSNRCVFAAPLRQSRSRTGGVRVMAAENDRDKRLEAVKKGLADQRIDQATAKKILEMWRANGLEDPKEVKKLLLNRSLTTAGVILLQTFLDAGASYFATSTGAAIGATNSFGSFSLPAQFVAYFLGSYFAIGVIADLFTLGATSVAAYQFGTQGDVFMTAVKELAGPATGLSVVDKTAQATNTLKIVQSLNAIADYLKETGVDASEASTLKNLSAYLIIQRAGDKYGFTPERYGLTDEQARDIALVFARYDLNDDGVLELSELQRLFAGAKPEMTGDEVKEALKILDKQKEGVVNFDEFTDWWVNKIQEPVPQA